MSDRYEQMTDAELAVVGMKPEYKGDVTVDRMNVKFP